MPVLKFKKLKIGDKINKLTVIGESNPVFYKASNGKYYAKKKWVCECDCGNTTIVEDNKLKSGHTKSCGCLNFRHNIPLTLDKSISKYISVAQNLLNRCRNPHCSDFHRYGGRGITCELGETNAIVAKELSKVDGWFKGAEIDRIDNNGNYTIDNIRWVTHDENLRNSTIVTSITKEDISMGLLTVGGFLRNINNMGGDPAEYERIDVEFPTLRDENLQPLYLFVHNSYSWNDKMRFYNRLKNIYSNAISEFKKCNTAYDRKTAPLLKRIGDKSSNEM